MLVIKRKYLLLIGIAILFTSLILSTIPRYLEIRKISENIENELPKLEKSYNRYIEQLKAIEEIKKILKNPPEIEPGMFNGVRISRRGEEITLRGVVNGEEFVKMLNYFIRNPNSYIEYINLRNHAENPMSISTPVESQADVHIKVRILELKK